MELSESQPGRAKRKDIQVGEQPVQMPGREGEWHTPSSLAQNWMHEKESTAPSGKRNEQGSLGTQPLRTCVVPTLAQVMWLLSLERSFSMSWSVGYHAGHLPIQDLLLSSYQLCQTKMTMPILQIGKVRLQPSVWILPGSSMGYDMSPRLLHLEPGAQ